jgi:hypothetical protein
MLIEYSHYSGYVYAMETLSQYLRQSVVPFV